MEKSGPSQEAIERRVGKIVEALRKSGNQSEQRPLTEAENDIISILADAAYRGVDIQQEYPAIYDQVLNTPAMRLAMLDLLADL